MDIYNDYDATRSLINLKSLRLSGQDQDDIKHLESFLDED
jgi:hypothetical protein